VRRAFELVISRPPDESELVRSISFIGKLKTQQQLPPELALQRFAVAVFSFNEFFYLD
jgi:hypothetical protein